MGLTLVIAKKPADVDSLRQELSVLGADTNRVNVLYSIAWEERKTDTKVGLRNIQEVFLSILCSNKYDFLIKSVRICKRSKV